MIAYVVPFSWPAPPVAELRQGLGQRLPEYMVPSTFLLLEGLPVTSTGKVDRASLPVPSEGEPAAESHARPRSPVEATMADIWAEVFHLERVGIHDDFFQLGGHSLLAGQTVARVRRAFGVDLPLSALFDAPTIAELCNRLGSRQAPAEGDTPVVSGGSEV